MNLVIQSPGLDRNLVELLAGIAGASAIEQAAPKAFRVRNARRNPAIAAWCEERRIDYAWMPAGRRFAPGGTPGSTWGIARSSEICCERCAR